jgi:flagellar basal-body rod modification protein FlgD
MTLPVSNLGATSGLGAAASANQGSSSSDALANLSSNEFLQLLVTELTNQSPLSPMDPSQMVAQTSQLSMVQILSTISTELQGLETQQAVLQGSSLIGKVVEYSTNGGSSTASGTVQGISINQGQLELDISGSSIPVQSVLSVSNASSA